MPLIRREFGNNGLGTVAKLLQLDLMVSLDGHGDRTHLALGVQVFVQQKRILSVSALDWAGSGGGKRGTRYSLKGMI